MGNTRKTVCVTSLLEIEKRWIGQLLKYNCPKPYIAFSEEQISTTNKFNKTLLWFEKMNSFLATAQTIRMNEIYHLYQNGDISLLIDLEERKALGGRTYRIYKMLKEEKNICFILSETDGELAMYFQPVSFSDV